MRIVIDTTTLVTGMLGMNYISPPRQIFDVWIRKMPFILLTSEWQLNEVKRTMHKPYFTKRISSSMVGRHINTIREEGEIITVASFIEGIGTHPEDDKIAAIAINGKADYLVTSDLHFQQAAMPGKIKIVSPSEFLYLIRWSL